MNRRRLPLVPLAFGLVMLLFLLVPTLVVLWRGLNAGLAGAFATSAVLEALRISLVTTLITLALTVVLGAPVAYLFARYDFPGRVALEALLDLPIMLPPVVAGLGLLLTFGRNGVFGPGLRLAGIELAFSPAAVVMAQLFVAAPYFIRAARAGFAGVDLDLERAAMIDGATRLERFRWITWPLAWPALLEGMVLSWARALGEFGATILFAGSLEGRTRTMTLAVYTALESDLNAALALSGVLAVVAFALLTLFRGFAARRATT